MGRDEAEDARQTGTLNGPIEETQTMKRHRRKATRSFEVVILEKSGTLLKEIKVEFLHLCQGLLGRAYFPLEKYLEEEKIWLQVYLF